MSLLSAQKGKQTDGSQLQQTAFICFCLLWQIIFYLTDKESVKSVGCSSDWCFWFCSLVTCSTAPTQQTSRTIHMLCQHCCLWCIFLLSWCIWFSCVWSAARLSVVLLQNKSMQKKGEDSSWMDCCNISERRLHLSLESEVHFCWSH